MKATSLVRIKDEKYLPNVLTADDDSCVAVEMFSNYFSSLILASEVSLLPSCLRLATKVLFLTHVLYICSSFRLVEVAVYLAGTGA